MLNRTFTPFPILTTERLTLRQLVISDEQEIFTLRSDSEINKYLNRQVSNTIDDARNFINKVSANINKGSFLSLISNSTGLKEHRISAQQKALAISGKAERHKLST